jgi:hypothetical protein
MRQPVELRNSSSDGSIDILPGEPELLMADTPTLLSLAGAVVSGIVTISTLIIRASSREKLAAIKAGTEQAAEIVKSEVEAYGIRAINLDRADQYKLAEKQVSARITRLLIIALTFLATLVILAITTVILFLASRAEARPDPKLGSGGEVRSDPKPESDGSELNEGDTIFAGRFRFLRCLPLQIDPILEIAPGLYRVEVFSNPRINVITTRACFGNTGNGDGPLSVCKGNGESIQVPQTIRLFGLETNLAVRSPKGRERDLEGGGLACGISNDGEGYTLRLGGEGKNLGFEVVLTMRRVEPSPPRPPLPHPDASLLSHPECNFACTGTYPSEGLDLQNAVKYSLNTVDVRIGNAKSFTLHKDNGPNLIDVTAGDRQAVVRGPARITICSTVPGTGGGCATRCVETETGARLFTDEYSVGVALSCR